jgi:hypothetical protein
VLEAVSEPPFRPAHPDEPSTRLSSALSRNQVKGSRPQAGDAGTKSRNSTRGASTGLLAATGSRQGQ